MIADAVVVPDVERQGLQTISRRIRAEYVESRFLRRNGTGAYQRRGGPASS